MDAGSPPLLPSAAPLWFLQTRVFSDEGATSYAIPTATLDGKLGNERAIEQGGGGWIFAPSKPDGSFLMGYFERSTLTRYEVTPDNRFVEGTTISFGNFGVMTGTTSIAWVDAHTAYWIDNDQRMLVRFDPAAMKIERAIPIEGVERPGFVTEFSGYLVVRDDGVFFPVRWRKEWEDPSPAAPAGAMLVHVDPATDAVTVSSDPRCTSLLLSKTLPNGDTYWFSDNYNTYARILGGDARGVPDCALRLKKGEKTFDPSWYLDLTTRTGGRPSDAVVAGVDATVWLSVFQAEALTKPADGIDGLDPAPAWKLHALDLAGDAPAVPSDRPLASHPAFGWYADGRSFSSTTNMDYSESKLLELTAQGFTERATVPGLLDTIVRVR